MTTELTKAAQQACHCQTCRPITMEDMRMVLCPTCGNKRCPHANDHRNACTGSNEPGQPGSAYPASALTQRPAAQEVEHPPHRLCGCDACSPSFEGELPSPQRPAAQTERDTGPRVLREVFALCEDTMDKMAAESTEFSRGRAFEAKGISRAIGTWFQDEYCGRSYMGEPSLPAPQQATPEPLIVKGAMAGMVDAQVRDLWPTKGATPEPVGEAIIGRWLYEKWWAEYGKLADVDKPYYTFDELPEKQQAAYDSLALMLTHPAPAVPEGFDSGSLTGNHVTLCFESKDAALVWFNTLAAAQAKGGVHG